MHTKQITVLLGEQINQTHYDTQKEASNNTLDQKPYPANYILSFNDS